jgi:uncharacterized protein YggE
MAPRRIPVLAPAILAPAAFALAVFIAAAALPAAAQDRNADPLAGATLLTLSESAERDVAPDTMRARLAAQATAADAAAAQTAVNAAMTKALAMVKTMNLDVQTGGYNTWQEAPARPASLPAGAKPPAPQWQAQQSLIVTGTDSDKLLAAVGELQKEGLLLQDLGFAISRSQQRALQDEMQTEALQRLTARAEKAAAALGLHFDGWHRIGLNGGSLPRPMMDASFARAKTMAAAPPVAAPGEQTLSVNVDGEAILRRR